VSNRLKRLSEFDEGLWVVPYQRVADSKLTDPSRARSKFGVDAVVTANVEIVNGGYRLDLRVYGANTMKSRGSIEVSTAASDAWHLDLSTRLADVFDVKIDDSQLTAATASYTRKTDAFEHFILGRGYLASAAEAADDSAISVFDDAIAKDSLFAGAYVCRAQALYQRHSQSGNSQWADEALADAYLVRGQVLNSLGKKEEAITEFARAIEVSKRDPEARRLLWRQYLRLGQFERAEEVCRDAIEVNPRHWQGYENLGYLYYATGKYEDAIAEFEIVADIAPDHAPTYNYLGALYYVTDRWENAIAMFEQSFALQKNYEACANLGTLYYMEGRFNDAAQMYEWAREYDHTDHILIGNLASAYYWMPEDRERATPLFETAIELAHEELSQSPDDGVLIGMLAVYYSVNHPDTALYFAERALALDPDNADVLFRSAMVYEQLGQRARALVVLGDAIANGCPVKAIAHERHFQELREDPRYELLVAEKTPSNSD
jgi:tetratricopeptide (TPR) repeat protein